MIDEIVKMAEEAGRRILEVYRGDEWEVSEKPDRSPVTRADLLSHRYLCETLTRQFSFPVLSEEDPLEYDQRKDWEAFWLVDPLDGTRDFLHRNDEFTVNIALVRNEVPVLGVIHNPALGETYFAEKGKGAFRSREGEKREALPAHSSAEAVGTVSRFHGGKEVAQFFEKHGIDRRVPCGSAIKFCRLAEGRVTVYPRFSGSMEWDIAAGQVLVEESGGQVLAIGTGAPPRYNKPSLFSPHFIAFREPHQKATFFS